MLLALYDDFLLFKFSLFVYHIVFLCCLYQYVKFGTVQGWLFALHVVFSILVFVKLQPKMTDLLVQFLERKYCS